jgi:hypothetical protein
MQELKLEVELLWPTTGAATTLFDSWLERARGIQERFPIHVAALKQLGRQEPANAGDQESMDSFYLRAEGAEVLQAIGPMLAEELVVMEKRAVTAMGMFLVEANLQQTRRFISDFGPGEPGVLTRAMP